MKILRVMGGEKYIATKGKSSQRFERLIELGNQTTNIQNFK